MKRRGLGTGLDALLGSAEDDYSAQRISIDQLFARKHQPRRHFDKESLAALADSIRQHGIIQPIVARSQGNRYEILAGERRFRAAQLAGLKTIPVILRRLADDKVDLLALIENIQRVDLNAIEKAHGIAALIKLRGLTHQQASDEIGLSRSAVSNLLRLLELSETVQKMMIEGKIDMGQARPLLALAKDDQEKAAETIVSGQLTARQAESLVKTMLGKKQKTTWRCCHDIAILEENLSKQLGTRVHIAPSSATGGRLSVYYQSRDALEEIIAKLQGK